MFQVDHPVGLGFIAGRHYVFRVDWVENPKDMSTVATWTMGFSGEASHPFPGIAPWTLQSATVAPRDAMEGASNTVSMGFELHTAVPAEGYLHIQAPGGFLVPLSCQLQISSTHPQEPAFLATNYRCEGVSQTVSGVAKPTSSARVYMVGRPLNAGVPYTLQLAVQNPAVSTPIAESWSVRTFRRLTWISAQATYEALDASTVGGFRIHRRLGIFRLDVIPPQNGLAQVVWEFSMQFREQVFATDLVEFRAPSGYSLQDGASSSCSQHQLLLGTLSESSAQCSGPCYREATCTGGTMRWQLRRCPGYQSTAADPEGLCLPQESTLRFKLTTHNPETTPALNSFFLQHTDLNGNVLSSGTHGAYHVIPLLTNVGVEPYSFTPSGALSEAVGSQSTIRLNFTTRTAALTVKILGGVNGSSFRFSAAQAFDGLTGLALSVHERDAVHVVFSMRQQVPPNTAVVIVLSQIQNAQANGVSDWTITTYDQYNAVMGPTGIADQRIGAPGFRIVGYVSVLTSSALSPVYLGSHGASVRLNFRSTVLTPAGEEVLISPPRGYLFDSPLISCSGGIQPVNVSVKNASAGFAGRYTRNSSAGDAPVFAHVGGLRSLYWHQASWQWVISPSAGRAATGLLGEAVLSVPGSAPGGPRPSVTDASGTWRVGSGAGWQQVQQMVVFMEGKLELTGRRLALQSAEDLPAETEAVVAAKVSLPTTEESDRKWLVEVRRSADRSLLGTNDAQFGGFLLLWHLPFTVVPALRAPNARSTLTLTFNQVRRIQGLTIPFPTSVRFDLIAPAPLPGTILQNAFRFPARCLSPAEDAKANKLFVQCAGSAQTASLTSRDPIRIWGTGLIVELLVDLPLETPPTNQWSLVYFLQTSSVRSAHGAVAGFGITPMPASLQGNNQLGAEASGYFTFQPFAAVPPGSEIRISAPEGRGYQVTCWRFSPGTLPKAPACSKVLIEEAVALTVPVGGSLSAGVAYTVGVRITNPTSFVPSVMNNWIVAVRDAAGNIQDAEFLVQGHPLHSLKISAPETVTVVRQGMGSASVTIPVTFGQAVPAGTISQLQLAHPANFQILRSKAAGLPLAASPFAQGSALRVPLSGFVPQGQAVIEVSVTEAPGPAGADGRWAGVWSLQALTSSDELVYQHAMAGVAG